MNFCSVSTTFKFLVGALTKGTKLHKGENSHKDGDSKSSRGVQGSQGAIKNGAGRGLMRSLFLSC